MDFSRDLRTINNSRGLFGFNGLRLTGQLLTIYPNFQRDILTSTDGLLGTSAGWAYGWSPGLRGSGWHLCGQSGLRRTSSGGGRFFCLSTLYMTFPYINHWVSLNKASYETLTNHLTIGFALINPYMCQGLTSYYFHLIGDKLINPLVGVKIYPL